MNSLKISVLNVGHGDFIYAETPLGNKLVIDCGSDGGNVVPSLFLHRAGIIDELQISHPHTDHFGDIIDISKKHIRSFLCPNLDNFSDEVIGWKNQDKAKIAELRQLKREIGFDHTVIKCDKSFERLVYCPRNVDYDDANTASFVTMLRYGNFKMLFGGDLPDSGWIELLRRDDFKKAIRGTDVFKVPHHGRMEGCSEALFQNIYPKLCIISDKPIDDTNKNTVATGWYENRTNGMTFGNQFRKVLSTRNDGSIFIEVSENGGWKVYLNTKWK